MPLLFAVIGTTFLVIAVIGNSKLTLIEINPGLFGRFLGLILGLGFYILAFYSLLFPLESWQTFGDSIRGQVQENFKSLVPNARQIMTSLTELKLEFTQFAREIKALANQGN